MPKRIKNLGYARTAVALAVATLIATPHVKAATLTNSYQPIPSAQSSTPIVQSVPHILPAIETRDKLDAWLDKLVHAESSGREKIRIVDVNGYFSYGCLQFQLATFRAYGERYGLVEDGLSNTELRRLIYDCNLQKQIAREMILENYANWRHWYTSVKKVKVGFPPDMEKPEIVLSISENRI